METSDNGSHVETKSTTEPPKDVVFKIPKFVKKSVNKSDKSLEQSNEKTVDAKSKPDLANSKSDPLVDASASSAKEKRPLISFQPKSLTLPSQVYKPHRPSATEYIEHYHKKDREKKLKVFETESTNASAVDTEEKKDKPLSEEGKKQSHSNSKHKSTKLSYDKPEWSCLCEADVSSSYSLEVLKSGSIVDKIDLVNKEYFVFGRLSDCDIVLEHPSISRHHAVLQFGKPTETDDVEFQKDGSAGFYLFDLGSTHGTRLNKVSAPSRKYYRVKVGHMMKFGGSSRMYILQGPQVDEEEESKETASELREKAREARKKKDLAKMMMGDESDDDDDDNDENAKSTSSRAQKDSDSGITWGMLEEAVMESDEEEEEETKEEEPTFSLQDKKDPFYVKDPNKALKNFYDKEGMEVDFECFERRPGQWNVRLELPIDTPSGKAVVADVSITGKKKEAMNNCALEACRLLDKYGMFKQSEHHRRKVKEWEKEDFYDSDEDQYWDRTGDLDKKRQQRKMRIGVKAKNSQDQPQTYEALKKQVDDLENEIANIEKQLEKDKQAVQTKQGSKDPLEEFMMQVKSGKTLDSMTRTKLKRRLFEARKESSRLHKLAEIARPASLPSLASQSSKSMSFIGKMKGKKKGLLVPSTRPLAPVFKPPEITDDSIEEEEENESASQTITSQHDDLPTDTTVTESKSGVTETHATPESLSQSASLSLPPSFSPFDCPTSPKEVTEEVKEIEPEKVASEKSPSPHVTPVESSSKSTSHKRTFGPTLPQDLKDRLMGGSGNSVENSPKKKKKDRKKSCGNVEISPSCSNDPNYADWIPPENQTGDGTTSLNAKFGY